MEGAQGTETEGMALVVERSRPEIGPGSETLPDGHIPSPSSSFTSLLNEAIEQSGL